MVYLAYGPDKRVSHYEGCIVNGLRFRTKSIDLEKTTQNCGVVVKVDDASGSIDYYGILVDIVKLDYLGDHHVILFKCDWYEGKSVQKDKYNYTSVNLSKPWKTSEPYVLATQAEQVYFVGDGKLGNDWRVVVPAPARSLWEVAESEEEECIITNEYVQQNESHSTVDIAQHFDDIVQYCRNDIPPLSVSATTITPRKERPQEEEEEEQEQEEEEEEEEADDTSDFD